MVVCVIRMMSVKDWVLSQLVSKSLATSRPLSASDTLLSDEPSNGEFGNQVSDNAPYSSRSNQENQNHVLCSSSENQENLSHLSLRQDSSLSNCKIDENKLDPLGKIENLQIKFLRALHRLGVARDNLMASKVLYRIHLATLIRAGESDLKRTNLRSDRAQEIAAEQEANHLPELDFSFKILVLGKSGVGKSSTINSIFDQLKATTDAFQPATSYIQNISGTVNGIKVSFIDTPGLLPFSPKTLKKNRKILYAVKRHVKKSPPDIILYFERLDLIKSDYSDFPLLKLIGEIFGPAIWFSTILVMTHASSALPEGPNGYPVNYESFVSHCTEVVQHYIHQAVSDTTLENPVILVDNHPRCKSENTGERVLPNGQVWRCQFFLLCLCTKVLGDVNSFLNFEDSIHLGRLSSERLPSLPHLLSSFLKHRTQLNLNQAGNELDMCLFPDIDEEDEYDQLPPIRILTKAQFEKLSNLQKEEYQDELDYREILYLKKQLQEESLRKAEKRSRGASGEYENHSNDQEVEPEPILLPDMAIPPSFDSDCPVHRYHCLVSSDQWITRPVLDPHGWDHDVGFDGINLETASEIRENVFASITGQLSKDKQDFSIQSESAAAFVDPRGPTYNVALDIQSTGKEFVCTVHSNIKLKNLKHNLTDCGVSLTSFGNKCFLGAKLEDSVLIGRQLKLGISAGRMAGAGQVACGGSFEATIRGRHYPVRDDKVSFAMTVLSFKKEIVLGGNIQSDFRLNRGTRMSVNANLNSQRMGQISVKTTSSEHTEIALIALVSIFRAFLRKKANDDCSNEVG